MTHMEPDWLLFASDATLVAVWGGALLLIAGWALVMERRRHRRDRVGAPDRVGWVPWTLLFLTSAILGMGLLAASLPGLFRS